MSKNKKIGIFFIILPFLLLVTAMLVYGIASYAAQKSALSAPPTLGLAPLSPSITYFRIARVVASLVGMLGVLGIFVSVPLGIFFLVKKTPESAATEANPNQLN